MQRAGLHRALAVLTAGAFATLVAEATALGDALPVIGLGAVFTLAALVVPARLDRAGSPRRVPAAGYVVLQLALGFVLFALAGAGVGATLLLVVLVCQAVLLLPLPAAAAVAALVPLAHLGMDPADGFRNGLGLFAAVTFAAVVTELLQREQHARADLAAANVRLRGYAAQAGELATIRERNRLARDIHDGLGHHLTVIGMQVQAARAVLADPGRADAVLADAQQQVSEALDGVRRSVAALREPRADPPLATALDVLAAESSAAGLPSDVAVTGAPRPLPPEVEESLFRAAQEGLTNARKHAGASRVQLLLDWSTPGTVRLRVVDDGAGVPAPRDGGAPSGFGLLGLRERAEGVGGRVVVGSGPGGGTTLEVEVPG